MFLLRSRSSDSSSQHPRRENLRELDCLRGIAILLVFFHHADGMLTPKLGAGGIEMSALRSFVGGGHSGVSLFFVLSAFCLSLPLFRPGADFVSEPGSMAPRTSHRSAPSHVQD